MKKAFILLSIAVTVFFLLRYGDQSSVFHGDSLGYYSYLPATLIYHNLDSIEYLSGDKGVDSTLINRFANLASAYKTPLGKTVIQYTYGIALMELPFFMMAHLYEWINGLQASGYSYSYRLTIKLASLCYSLLGILFLFRGMLLVADKRNVVITICILFIGSNLFWFSTLHHGMAHSPLFFLYALLLFLTIKVHQKASTSYFSMMGFVLGLITVIRPTDFVAVLIPLLYNIYDRKTLKQKIQWIQMNYTKIGLAILLAALPIIPQLLYWKWLSGTWVYYSYGDQGFNWLQPRIWEGLFSFKNGWLIYSPIMFFSILGIFLYKYHKAWQLSLLVLVPIYIYIIYAWWCYNYINGLGSRPMIHLYPLLAIPLCSFIGFIENHTNRMLKILFWGIAIFLISINLLYSVHSIEGRLWSEDANMTYNISTLFKCSIDYNDLVCFDTEQIQPDKTDIHDVKQLASIDTNYHLRKEEEFSQVRLAYNLDLKEKIQWFRCSGYFLSPYRTPSLYDNHILVFEIRRNDQTIVWKGCRINNKIGVRGSEKISLFNQITHVWDEIAFYVKAPKSLALGDELLVYVWNIGKQELKIQNLKIDVCN